jgi:hypothetical protein
LSARSLSSLDLNPPSELPIIKLIKIFAHLYHAHTLLLTVCRLSLQEAEVIDGIKKALQTRINESFEQLCLLQEARQQVQADLQDKNIALGIDIDQYNLTDKSSQISYKPDSMRVPKGSEQHIS